MAWDLRGDLEGGCPNGLRNAIYGYNISDGANNQSVGLRATGNSWVSANNNEWQTSTISQNVTAGDGSFVQVDVSCVPRGCSQ